jgi:hypothetical protein
MATIFIMIPRIGVVGCTPFPVSLVSLVLFLLVARRRVPIIVLGFAGREFHDRVMGTSPGRSRLLLLFVVGMPVLVALLGFISITHVLQAKPALARIRRFLDDLCWDRQITHQSL